MTSELGLCCHLLVGLAFVPLLCVFLLTGMLIFKNGTRGDGTKVCEDQALRFCVPLCLLVHLSSFKLQKLSVLISALISQSLEKLL